MHFKINNCSSIASARQARIIMYTGTVGILLKKIWHILTTFQVSNDQKEFQFDMTLASRLSDTSSNLLMMKPSGFPGEKGHWSFSFQ